MLVIRFERVQYADIRRRYVTGPTVKVGEEKDMSAVYGAEHLLRMLGNFYLPSILVKTKIMSNYSESPHHDRSLEHGPGVCPRSTRLRTGINEVNSFFIMKPFLCLLIVLLSAFFSHQLHDTRKGSYISKRIRDDFYPLSKRISILIRWYKYQILFFAFDVCRYVAIFVALYQNACTL